MLTKLYDIERNSHKKIERKLKTIYNFSPKNNSNHSNFTKTNYSSGKNLLNNISLTNENRNLHRRINQKCSIYSISKWDEEYKKSQEYKKNLCQYPSVDFNTIVSNDMKKINRMKVQNNNNIFNEIRFKPFVSFEDINKKHKSEKRTINNNNNRWNKQNENYFYLYDDDRIKKRKERKRKEEEKRRKEDEKMRKKADEEEKMRKIKDDEEKRKREIEEKKKREEEERKKKKKRKK